MGARHSSEFKRPVSSDGMSPKMSAALKRLDSKPKPLRRRAHSFSFDSNDEPWGWFEDFETSKRYNESSEESKLEQHLQRALSLPAPATSPPIYVLESSLATQHLWYETAGRRPKQPQHEREYFERLWLKNFEVSSVQYEAPSSNTLARLEKIPKSECDGEILFRGKGPFSNSVSKSFSGHDISSLTLQVKRSSCQNFKNTLLSWQCLLNRKRFYRCLEKEYLSLKCFLLERFMQDLLFESSDPDIISDFLGLE